jgi:hypothetical protein
VYATFDRMFDCRGHGWSNLQSTHLNLPYQGDDEFGRLHAAIRLVLPILPALAASSPIVEGRLTGVADNRLQFYRHNCARIPIVTGSVIPEQVFTQEDYRAQILRPIAEAVAPFDEDEVLDAEWVNARGAIARLDRESIEIRVLDVQEHAAADVAIVALTVALLRGLTEERWSPGAAQREFSVERLSAIFLDCVRRGSAAVIEDGEYLAALGLSQGCLGGRELWRRIAEGCLKSGLLPDREEWTRPLGLIVEHGTLSERISRAVGENPQSERIREVYRELSACLLAGRPFEAS